MADWSKLGEFADRASAETVVQRLGAEDIAARVESTRLLAGLESGFSVVVAPEDMQRAEEILSGESDISDEELEELAISSPGLDDE